MVRQGMYVQPCFALSNLHPLLGNPNLSTKYIQTPIWPPGNCYVYLDINKKHMELFTAVGILTVVLLAITGLFYFISRITKDLD